MRFEGFYSRSFLVALTISLLMHLILLLAILLPSNYHANAMSDQLSQQNDADFSPSLLISYSPEKLQDAMAEVDDLQKLLSRQSVSWAYNDFRNSFQLHAEKMNINISSLSLQKSRLDQESYSVKIVSTTTADRILADFLATSYLSGIATTRSNFRSDHLLITFTNQAGAIINLSVPTSDCRLFAQQKMTVTQFMQQIDLS